MEGSDSATSPELKLAAGALDPLMMSDADTDELVHGRHTLFAVCAYALLKTIPELRVFIDDIPHSSSDTGHSGGNRCFRCNLKELNKYILMDYPETQRIKSSLFVYRNWEPKTAAVDLGALMDEVLSEIACWFVQKDYENIISMAFIQSNFQKQLNDLLLFQSSTKWGCYNCGVHFTSMNSNKSIYMDGRSIDEFQEEQYMNCSGCLLLTGYKLIKACNLPQVLIFYEVSGLPSQFRISNKDYGLTCILPEKNKARLYFLLEPMNWTRIDASEFEGRVHPLGPALPLETLDKCAIAIYRRI